MKRIFTLVLVILVMGGLRAQQTIPNGDFETWYTVPVSQTVNYEEIGSGPADNWLGTLNALAAVPALAGGPGPVTVFKTTDKYRGNFAAKAVSATFQFGPVPIFIPGMIGTAVLDMANIRALIGKPCADCRPMKLKGFFKFEPVNGDSCSAAILLSKWNPVSGRRDTVGFGRIVQKEAVETWKEFEVPVNYNGTGPIDSISVLVVASAGYNLSSFMECAGQPGTTMYVDDLMLEYPAGLLEPVFSQVSVKVYPNPVSDFLNIELERQIPDAWLEIFNNMGKQVQAIQMDGTRKALAVKGLPSGIYHYRLSGQSGMLGTGTFVVNQ